MNAGTRSVWLGYTRVGARFALMGNELNGSPLGQGAIEGNRGGRTARPASSGRRLSLGSEAFRLGFVGKLVVLVAVLLVSYYLVQLLLLLPSLMP